MLLRISLFHSLLVMARGFLYLLLSSLLLVLLVLLLLVETILEVRVNAHSV